MTTFHVKLYDFELHYDGHVIPPDCLSAPIYLTVNDCPSSPAVLADEIPSGTDANAPPSSPRLAALPSYVWRWKDLSFGPRVRDSWGSTEDQGEAKEQLLDLSAPHGGCGSVVF